MELGEWDLPRYQLEKSRQTNQAEKVRIEIERAKLDKAEVELKIAEIETHITELTNSLVTIQKSINWSDAEIKKRNG